MNYQYPDERGHFGQYGGRYVAETLMPALLELEQAYAEACRDPEFQREFKYYLKHYVGRPSPLYYAQRLSDELGGAKIYLKREDLNHTGAHKVNNTVGQILLARPRLSQHCSAWSVRFSWARRISGDRRSMSFA